MQAYIEIEKKVTDTAMVLSAAIKDQFELMADLEIKLRSAKAVGGDEIIQQLTVLAHAVYNHFTSWETQVAEALVQTLVRWQINETVNFLQP